MTADGYEVVEGDRVARKAKDEEKEPEAELEEELEDDDLEEVDGDEDDVATGLAMAADDDEDGEEASLEELLAQRAAGRRAAGEPDDEDDDIMALSSEREPTGAEVIRTKVIPLKDRQEFVCKRCHLVKARSQLADEERMLCRDCV